jgi:ribose transport system permease protein
MVVTDTAASVNEPRGSSSEANSYLLVPMLLFFALLITAVLRSPNLISSAGIGSAIIVGTPLVLATYSVMASTLAGRATVDLSIGPLIGFVNVTLVELFGMDVVTSPVAFFVYAIGVGILYQILMALIVIFVRVQPIIVALSGYLALSGINLVIMVRPGGTAPDWMASWGLGTSILSPVFAILVLATAAWLLFTRTAFYGHLRLMGSDERAAYTSGVRINIVRVGAHVIAGIFAGLAALTYTSLIASGDPTQGTTYTLIAVTALVLGGANLAGGRGGVIGSLLGAVNIYLITFVLATFSFGKVQSFVTDLSYGTVLVISLLLTVVLPHLRGVLRYVSPLLFFVVLSLLAIGVIIYATYDDSPPARATAAPAAPANAATYTATPPARAERFIFEETGKDISAAVGHRSAARPIASAAVLLLSLLVIVRALISQADTRSLAPLVYVVVAALVLLCIYILTNPASHAGTSAPAHSEGRP